MVLSIKALVSSSKTVSEVEASYKGEVLGAFDNKVSDRNATYKSVNGVEYSIAAPSEVEIQEAEIKYKEKLRRIEEEKRRKAEEERRKRLNRVSKLENYLSTYGSPMSPHAETILQSCEKYGDHYCKFFLSIAGIESGYGRVAIGCCNAWGMMGVHWSSWEESIPAASDWIAANYYLKGVDTFEELAYSSYGPHDPEAWIGNLYSFYNKIPL